MSSISIVLVPHIGHLYSAVLADVLRRWYEFKGHKAILSTGTDEHGQKIQEAAAKQGISPRVFCDDISKEFKKLFDTANISYTDYIRTTDARHKEAVHALWKRLSDAGHIYKGHHEGWYSVSDETFVPSNQLEEIVAPDGRKSMISKESGNPVVWTKEENYKFRLGAFRENLLKWLRSNPDCEHQHVVPPPLNMKLINSAAIIPKLRYNEIVAALSDSDDHLTDLSVSRVRSRLQWGIPVPGDEDHVVYVWLDALTNYLTVTGYPWKTAEQQALKDAWPAQSHVIGKDIIKFHAIYWPAFLMAAGLPLPKQIIAHGHWLMGDHKMSKSRGNVVDPYKLLEKFGADPVRYYFVRDGGIAYDGAFAFKEVAKRYRKDLADQLGNLVMRCASKKVNPAMEAPREPDAMTDFETALIKKLESLRESFTENIERADFASATEQVYETVLEGNHYWDATQPWLLAKAAYSKTAPDPTAETRLQTVLYFTFETVRIAALMLQPIMPTKMAKLLDDLGVEKEERRWENAEIGRRWRVVGADQGQNTKISKMEPLFPKWDEEFDD
ncbi:methionyl-tRNA synthetase [Rhizophlyctis rosea]|uniref:methionine--tRNA ligase n=1 Tax=Rhizophlyctis rosea TaxID=64517 RepID=A0AAD5SIQ2_9FUNG|nr:methionyl-tRNA synthetase [Rhizophlyctis rosea]